MSCSYPKVQMKGTAGGTSLKSHLSSEELWEITKTQANSELRPSFLVHMRVLHFYVMTFLRYQYHAEGRSGAKIPFC